MKLFSYIIFLLCLSAAYRIQADENPEFQVPGHESEMKSLEQLLELHLPGAFTNCTLWDAWLPQSTVWTGPLLRDRYRQSLLSRRIDEEGYVAVQQHRGMAHSDGWPFPGWPQSTGKGFHFSLDGDSWAIQNFKLKPLTSVDGWEIEGAKVLGFDAMRRSAANLLTEVVGLSIAGTVFFNGLSLGWTCTAAEEPPTATSKDSGNDSQLGISTTKPEGPYFVALPNGAYMVPYTQTIPGTDVQFKMMPIPAGKFLMGSSSEDPYHQPDEGPQIEVEIEPFWMGQYEVTWNEFHAFYELDHYFRRVQYEGKLKAAPENEIDGVSSPTILYDVTAVYGQGDKPASPAGMLTQYSAKQYTKFLSLLTGSFYRLPTEAEWEYACRAGTNTTWYFGDDPNSLKEHAWFNYNSEVKGDPSRQLSGQKKPNPWGLYDMYGNVAEWTLDLYSKDAYLLKNTKNASINQSTSKDRKLESKDPPSMVLRGGGFFSPLERCRSAARQASQDEEWKGGDPEIPNSPYWFTEFEANEAGFRLLRTLNEPNDRATKELAWAAAHPNIADDVSDLIRTGRGTMGIVTPELANEIRELRKQQVKK